MADSVVGGLGSQMLIDDYWMYTRGERPTMRDTRWTKTIRRLRARRRVRHNTFLATQRRSRRLIMLSDA